MPTKIDAECSCGGYLMFHNPATDWYLCRRCDALRCLVCGEPLESFDGKKWMGCVGCGKRRDG